MSVDKTQIGLVFKSPRASRVRQIEALKHAGATIIHEVGKAPVNWRDAMKAVREGDTVYVYALVLVPSKRGDDYASPSTQMTEFMLELNDLGARLFEVYSGLTSASRKERTAMIDSAMKALRSGTRTLPEIGRAPGRPGAEWTDEQLLQARAAWFSKDYSTNEAAAKHMPVAIVGGKKVAFGARRAWALFGKSGRPWKAKKKSRSTT